MGLGCCRGGGMAKVDRQNSEVCDSTNSGLPDDDACRVAFDAQRTLWIGLNNDGLAVSGNALA